MVIFTVEKWSPEYKRGRDSLEDDPMPGRPTDLISQEMMDLVAILVLNDQRIKDAELDSEFGISNTLEVLNYTQRIKLCPLDVYVCQF